MRKVVLAEVTEKVVVKRGANSSDVWGLEGEVRAIRQLDAPALWNYAVEFSTETVQRLKGKVDFHDCNGLVSSGDGRWVRDEDAAVVVTNETLGILTKAQERAVKAETEVLALRDEISHWVCLECDTAIQADSVTKVDFIWTCPTCSTPVMTKAAGVAQRAVKKAEVFERDWRDAKHEFGVQMGKLQKEMEEERKAHQHNLSERLRWQGDAASLAEKLRRAERKVDSLRATFDDVRFDVEQVALKLDDTNKDLARDLRVKVSSLVREANAGVPRIARSSGCRHDPRSVLEVCGSCDVMHTLRLMAAAKLEGVRLALKKTEDVGPALAPGKYTLSGDTTVNLISRVSVRVALTGLEEEAAEWARVQERQYHVGRPSHLDRLVDA